MGMSQNAACSLGCLSRGYDLWVWFGVWCAGMIRGPWFSVSLHPPCRVIYPQLPVTTKMFQRLLIIPYVERFEAGMLLPLCMLLSEWCVRFGAGMVVPLECRCNLLVQGAACCQNAVCSLERACWWLSLRVLLQVLPESNAWRCCYQSGVCPLNHALERACWWADAGEGAVLLQRWCLRVLQGGYVMYPTRAARVLVKGAAARCCCCRVQLLEWRVRSGAGLLVPQQGAASRCCS